MERVCNQIVLTSFTIISWKNRSLLKHWKTKNCATCASLNHKSTWNIDRNGILNRTKNFVKGRSMNVEQFAGSGHVACASDISPCFEHAISKIRHSFPPGGARVAGWSSPFSCSGYDTSGGEFCFRLHRPLTSVHSARTWTVVERLFGNCSERFKTFRRDRFFF